jgi:ABC-type thiamine transport system ATPase subunit
VQDNSADAEQHSVLRNDRGCAERRSPVGTRIMAIMAEVPDEEIRPMHRRRADLARRRVLLQRKPLSNLDAKLRVQMRAELKRLHAKLGITTMNVVPEARHMSVMSEARP